MEKTDDSLQKGTMVDISLDDEVQITPKDSVDADVEDLAKDKPAVPYETPETDHIKTELSTDTAEWTPDPPIQEVYRTENDNIASMSDTFIMDDEKGFKAPYTPKQSVSDMAFNKADPLKIVGAIRTLIKKD
ncbi:MAG: hypothetical protein LBG05_07115 [Treponema sp.]|nr:hypothetical protein [Treponema sp.]